MKLLPRVVAVVAVAYLLVVAGLYALLSDRVNDFDTSAPTITGTIVRMESHSDVPTLGLGARRLTEMPVIQYTLQGKTHELLADGWSASSHHVGDHVTLVYDLGVPSTDADDLVLIKGQDTRLLRSIPPIFVVLAVLFTWLAATLGLVQLRRRRARRARHTASDVHPSTE